MGGNAFSGAVQQALRENRLALKYEWEPSDLEKEQGHAKQRITNGFQPCQAMAFMDFTNYWAWVPDPVAAPW